MGIRKAILGAGLIGALSGTAMADDDGYLGISQAESFAKVHQRSVTVDYNSWQREVLDYDGGVIVLFNSSCNETERAVNIDNNRNVVQLQIMDSYEGSMVNGDLLKFVAYNVCGDRNALKLFSGGIQVHMYLGGELIDSVTGGPTIEEKIPNSFRATSSWLESNLLGVPFVHSGNEMRVVYNGSPKATAKPFSTAPVQP